MDVETAGNSFVPGTPEVLFPVTVNVAIQRSSYDVTADGQRFLVNSIAESVNTSPITVVVNWTAGLVR